MLNIYPDIASQYLTKGNPEATKRFSSFIQQSLTLNEARWVEQNLDTRYEAGDQTLWNTYYNAWNLNPRQVLTFNHIRKIVNMLEGYQRAHRKTTICVPREGSDQHTADQFTQLLLYHFDEQNMYETISTAFRGALITGMNFIHLWMDYRKDPINGDLKASVVPYNAVIVDPFFTKMDMSDCNGIVKRSYVSPMDAASMLPEHASQILSMQGFAPSQATFQFMPQNYQTMYTELLTYDEFYYRTYREQKLLIDTRTGETAEWKSDDADALRAFLVQYPELKLQKQQVPTVNVTISVMGQVYFDGPNPLGIDDYPWVPVMTYYNPELEDVSLRCAGVVRNLRSVQFAYNHRKVIELRILESQLNSGWIAEENAVINSEDLFKTGEGQVIFTKKDKFGAIQKIQPGSVDPSMLQISQDLKSEIMDIANVSETLLGQSTDDLSGFHSQLRTASGITANQRLFDQLDMSQKILGDLIISSIQNNYTPGKVKRILQEDPSEQFYDKNFGRYDCSIQEGYDTPTQKQMIFAQLLNLRTAGIPIPDETMIENITMQNKDNLLKTLQQQAQMQAQMQQKQAELQMAQLESQIKMANAKALADEGLGIERLSRLEENKALATERMAEARKDRELGFLHLVEAIAKIQSIDLESIKKIIELGSMLEQKELPRLPQEAQFEPESGSSPEPIR